MVKPVFNLIVHLSFESLVLSSLNLAGIPELLPDEHLLLLQALRVLLDLQSVFLLQLALRSLHVLALKQTNIKGVSFNPEKVKLFVIGKSLILEKVAIN
jgi:hypothetical protein